MDAGKWAGLSQDEQIDYARTAYERWKEVWRALTEKRDHESVTIEDLTAKVQERADDAIDFVVEGIKP